MVGTLPSSAGCAGLRKGTPLASRVAQGVSGPPSSCVWNPRVFAHTHTHTHKYLEEKGRGMLSVFLVITELSVCFLIFNLEKTNILTFHVV